MSISKERVAEILAGIERWGAETAASTKLCWSANRWWPLIIAVSFGGGFALGRYG
jgi:hypothetical protein